ncbi:unnamed protein product, partial [Symbiodinium sp. CCMP2592]
MGCVVCNKLALEASRAAAECPLKKSRYAAFSTKFGRYEVSLSSSLSMQPSVIRAHEASRVHRRALKLWVEPERPLFQLLPEDCAEFEDQESLLRGHVPQVKDWIYAWRCCKSSLSFSAADQVQGTLSFLSEGSRGRAGPLDQRKSLKAMCLVMARAVKEQVLRDLSKAEAWCLTLDDRKQYRLFTYEASVVEEVDSVSQAIRKQGLLCVSELPSSSESLEGFEVEYCQKVADTVVKAIDDICEKDETLCERLKSTLLSVMGDGAASLQKGFRYLQSVFPKLMLLGKDPSHLIRRATGEALAREKLFSEYIAVVWESKESFVPSIQNSAAWRAELEAAQRVVVEDSGEQGGGLQRIMRHFRYAKQRFESSAHPHHVYCCLLSSVLLLCAVTVSAEGDAVKKKKAQTLLDSMSPRHAALAGLGADFGCESARLIRQFDVDCRDPAVVRRIVQDCLTHDWMSRMELLFLEGRVLGEAQAGGHAGQQMETATCTAITTLMEAPPLICKGQIKYLWTSDGKSQVLEALRSAQLVTKLCLRRLHADFSDCLATDLSVFDLWQWKSALQPESPSSSSNRAAEYTQFCEQAKRKLGRLCKAYNQSSCPEFVNKAWHQLIGFAEYFVKEGCGSLSVSQSQDNRPFWGVVMNPGLCQTVLGNLPNELRCIVHVYNSFAGGTGRTERALGCVTKQLEAHCGPMNTNTVESLTFLAFSPLSEESFAKRVSSSGGGVDVEVPQIATAVEVVTSFALTPLGFRCAELWVQSHGRRFNAYTKGGVQPWRRNDERARRRRARDGARRRFRKGCHNTAAANRDLACDTLVERAAPRLVANVAPTQASCKFDAWASAPSQKHPGWTHKLALYEQNTAAKKQENFSQRERLKRTGKAWAVPEPKRTRVLWQPPVEVVGIVLNLSGSEMKPESWPRCREKKLLPDKKTANHAFQATRLCEAVLVKDIRRGFPWKSESEAAVIGAALAATAYGVVVADCRCPRSCIRLDKGSTATRAKVTSRFEERHRDLCDLLRVLREEGFSILRPSSAASEEAHEINSISDLVSWMHKAQRVVGPGQ